ncbi:unnamed protein product [Lathyrus sativus]|nr:unnamed protein product [Lathyrus sativus]
MNINSRISSTFNKYNFSLISSRFRFGLSTQSPSLRNRPSRSSFFQVWVERDLGIQKNNRLKDDVKKVEDWVNMCVLGIEGGGFKGKVIWG